MRTLEVPTLLSRRIVYRTGDWEYYLFIFAKKILLKVLGGFINDFFRNRVSLMFQVRTIIISLSTIVALAPYRRAAIELICRKHNTQILPSMEVTVAVDCLNSRRRCRFIAHSGDTFGVDATLTQVEAYPCRR
uniref:Uncharacterized protein n=1 Tax=Parascaris equorum TaxID=6256 RepID=A0A914RRX7_PAREQ